MKWKFFLDDIEVKIVVVKLTTDILSETQEESSLEKCTSSSKTQPLYSMFDEMYQLYFKGILIVF